MQALKNRKGFLVALLLFPAIAAGQTKSSQPPSITVDGSASIPVQPDTAVVSFQVLGRGKTVQQAYLQAKQQAQQIRVALTKAALNPAQARLGSYQVNPDIDWKTRQTRGYTISSTIEVRLKDLHRLAPLLDSAASGGVPVQQLRYELSQDSTARRQALQQAFRSARDSAQAVAEAAGKHLGSPLSVQVSAPPVVAGLGGFGFYAAANRQALPPPTAGFQPQTVKVTAHLVVVFGIS